MHTTVPSAGLCADVRDAGQFKRPLMHIRHIPGHESVVRVLLAIAFSNVTARVACVRPMRSTDPSLEGILLPDKVFLRGIRYRHVASVDAEARLLRLRAEVVVRGPGIPYQQVAGLSAYLLPLVTLRLQPCLAGLGIAEPLWGPGRNAWLVDELLVEVLGGHVSAFADDEAAVIWSIGQQVDQTLQTSEAWLQRVLVLMWPKAMDATFSQRLAQGVHS